MTGAVTRRQLFARLRGGPAQIRPPWLEDEEAFLDRCTRCGDCAARCPEGIVVAGHGGYPIVDFARGACTFCGACVEACDAGCFAPGARDMATRAGLAPWTITAAVSGACVETKGVTCRMCEERCEATAIRFRPALGGRAVPSVAADDCNGCGACVAVCPVAAITVSEGAPVAGARA